jgi:hypothetical protein
LSPPTRVIHLPIYFAFACPTWAVGSMDLML